MSGRKLVLLGLLVLVLPAPPAVAAPPSATNLAAETGCSEEDPRQGYARLTWTPAPSGGDEQRVDVTVDRDGFNSGNFTTSEALPAQQRELIWTDLQGQAVHFWRVRTIGSDGVSASAESSFEGPTCAVDQQPSDPEVVRIAGASAAGTAAAVSRRVFASAETVVLARHDVYADALAGAALAGALSAPVLLTGSQRLDAVAAEEIRRLAASRAVLLGGPVALSPQVEQDVEALGVTTTRLAGSDRFETAARVAERVVADTGAASVYLVEAANADPARGWPDAVSVSGLAGLQGRPVLGVTRDTLPVATRRVLSALQVSSATIIGGSAAVGDGVAAEVAAMDIAVQRLAGRTRYETSMRVVDATLTTGVDGARVWLATGRRHQDALVAGPASAATAGVLLLVDGLDLSASPASMEWLVSVRDRLDEVLLVGDLEGISQETETEIKTRLQDGA